MPQRLVHSNPSKQLERAWKRLSSATPFTLLLMFFIRDTLMFRLAYRTRFGSMEILRRNPHKSSWPGAARDVCSHMTDCATFCGVWHRRASWYIALQEVLGCLNCGSTWLAQDHECSSTQLFIAVLLGGDTVINLWKQTVWIPEIFRSRENVLCPSQDEDRDLRPVLKVSSADLC